MKVAYATGSRADYGIVRRYLSLLNKRTDLSILVTGSHLEDKYGKTVKIIEDDGFMINFHAPLNIDNSTNAGVIHSMSVALDSFGRHFEDNRYDLLIILGDRYEMMSVAIAAAIQRIPILHLHGGEATFANYDEFIRHSITKMSTYHFASTEVYRKRIIQLGENPERVFNLGALGAENCQIIDLSDSDNQLKELYEKDYFVVAFHPETLSDSSLVDQVHELLEAIKSFSDKRFVFVGTNADTGSDLIRDTWKSYCNENPDAYYIENMDSNVYLATVKHAIALIGNSSSGIIEAPSLGVCTVNIGHRQDGRVCGNSVFNAECKKECIISAMKDAYTFRENNITINNPYYQPNTAYNYYCKTLELLHTPINNVKHFYDVF